MSKVSAQPISLIVGLGNPGSEYADTRHNAGTWFVEQLARSHGAQLLPERKFLGDCARIRLQGEVIHLLFPTTFMNRSGQAVAALARFYKIPPEAILVVHDELDLPAGLVKFKRGGGHGGHNGLRDIINHLGSREFARLRVGIGHPGTSKEVVNFVLGRPSRSEQEQIQACLDESLRLLPELILGHTQKAVQQLHSFKG